MSLLDRQAAVGRTCASVVIAVSTFAKKVKIDCLLLAYAVKASFNVYKKGSVEEVNVNIVTKCGNYIFQVFRLSVAFAIIRNTARLRIDKTEDKMYDGNITCKVLMSQL
jgi:hypothetical protein